MRFLLFLQKSSFIFVLDSKPLCTSVLSPYHLPVTMFYDRMERTVSLNLLFFVGKYNILENLSINPVQVSSFHIPSPPDKTFSTLLTLEVM